LTKLVELIKKRAADCAAEEYLSAMDPAQANQVMSDLKSKFDGKKDMSE